MSYRGADAVVSGVAAADYDYVLPFGGRRAVDLLAGEPSCGVGEEVNGEDDAVGVASVGAEIACLLCSGADYYGVEVFFEFSGADRVFGLAVSGDDVYAAAESDAFGLTILYEYSPISSRNAPESAGFFAVDGTAIREKLSLAIE